MCGDTRTLAIDQSGEPGGSGSTSNTSSAAPAIVPVRSASTRSDSTMVGPRPTLTTNPRGPSAPSTSAPTSEVVVGVSGTARTSTSTAAGPATSVSQPRIAPESGSSPGG